MNEAVSDLVQRLNGLNVDVLRELVLRNCIIGESAELGEQIRRCSRLRGLYCASCLITPRQLLQLIVERLQNLEELEFSLVEVVDATDISNVRRIAGQYRGVAHTERLRRLYAEIGGERNFQLLG
ncbi:hypothetical protein MTO96_012792 [Rhipicephalus appendiculatus]